MAKKTNTAASAHTRGRSVTPIKDTIEHVPGYPNKLIIFKVPSSPFWWTRTFFKGKHVKRSTETNSKRHALQYAKDFYDHLITGKPVGVVKNVHAQILSSFQRCVNGLQEEDEQRAKRGAITSRYATEQRRLMDRHIRSYFGEYDIADIDYPLLDKFATFLFQQDLASITVRMHFGAINRIFVYAQKHGFIKTAPIKPTIKAEDNPRGWFDLADYKKIRKASRRLLNYVWEERERVKGKGDEGKLIRKVIFTADTYYLMPFMIYTFVRPTDIKNLQHKHVEIRESDDGDYLYLTAPTSKRSKKPFISMPRATAVYQKLKQYQAAKGKAGEEDYLFFPEYKNRDTAYKQLARAFTLLLEQTGTRQSADGEDRAIYSLRHNSIMFALIYYGIDKKQVIALNARTSVEMIDRFYAWQLEPEHVRKQLHTKKIKPKSKSSKTVITPPRPATSKELEVFIKQGPDSVSPDQAGTVVIEKVVKKPGSKAKLVVSLKK